MPKISVICPIHNPGQYFKPLIESVINQTFKDIEILLIDDGSIDGTRDLLKEYEQQDNRIKVFFRDKQEYENFGEKYSIDLGRKNATGEYMIMIDHDDELPAYALELLYNSTENGTVDVVQGRSIKINNENKIIWSTPEFFQNDTIIFNWEKLSEEEITKHLIFSPVALWACLIRNDFQKNIKLADCVYNDNGYVWKLKLLAKKWKYIPQTVYTHKWHAESVSQQPDKYWYEIFVNFMDLECFIKENLFNPNLWKIYSLYEFFSIKGQLAGLTSQKIIDAFMVLFSQEIKRNTDISIALIDNEIDFQLYNYLRETKITV